ncbi:MAG TPA: hypothetical protein VMZ53_32615 [Kofleriaceae bacterium]|nr:hypothetical protein [Kofleriaceae bacterium]
MRSAIVAVMLAACGRIGFDAERTPDTSLTSACLEESFDQTLTAWNVLDGDGQLDPTGGPDGSGALRANLAGARTVFVAPGLDAVTSATFAADYYLMEQNGDFNVLLVKPGFTGVFPSATGYVTGVHPMGGDNADDVISRYVSGAQTFLVMRPTTLPVRTWRHFDFTRALDGSMSVLIDGAPFMMATDSMVAPPYALYVRVFGVGFVDNVRVDCTR